MKLVHKQNIHIDVYWEWKLADFWIGIYSELERPTFLMPTRLDVWVCLLPCIPIHFVAKWTTNVRKILEGR